MCLLGPYGAMVARLTPDQKVMCSNHIGVSQVQFFLAPMPGLSFTLCLRIFSLQEGSKKSICKKVALSPAMTLFPMP